MREEELAPAGRAFGPAVPVTTAASARAHTRAVVAARWDPSVRPAREEDVIDLLLVVSELVANALRHGGGLAGFELTPVCGGIRLAVHDHSDDEPAAAYGPGFPRAGQGTGGYGWPLVVRLARDITVEKRPTGGKTISVFVPVRATGRPG
ncbi:ATP-binding protein [Streptomyces sp. NBC_01235]|uniref:ATP-binding protein n=1 Tax=Streptomyces sp. NBC_01235 TaxID=2903788 RepID=UPI002E0D47B3|nr:ATP-binding protein [Streptomyces sp. NBC_01235]